MLHRTIRLSTSASSAASPEFEHYRNELVFARDLLNIPMAKADAALQQILEAQVVAVIEKLPKGEATTDAVRRHLAGELGEGQPTIEQIAPRLHMSPGHCTGGLRRKARAFGKS